MGRFYNGERLAAATTVLRRPGNPLRPYEILAARRYGRAARGARIPWEKCGGTAVATVWGAMDRQRGYTLIELMMVVILIGISMAIAIPTASTAVAETRQSEAALEVVSVFRTARSMAMRRATPVIVSFLGTGRFWITPARRLPGVVASCTSVNWPVERAFWNPPTELDFGAGTGPKGETFAWLAYGMNATFNVPLPAAICFSPLGRVYISTTGDGGPYSDVQSDAPGGAVQIDVRRAFGNPRRVIVPMGSGMARMRTQ